MKTNQIHFWAILLYNKNVLIKAVFNYTSFRNVVKRTKLFLKQESIMGIV